MKISDYIQQHESQLKNILTDDVVNPVPRLVEYIRDTSKYSDEDILTVVEIVVESVYITVH